jgi:hypothetical protein
MKILPVPVLLYGMLLTGCPELSHLPPYAAADWRNYNSVIYFTSYNMVSDQKINAKLQLL